MELILENLVWPAVALILGLVALGTFKKPIAQFLGRAQSFGKGWLVATPPNQQTAVVQTPEALEFLNEFSGELLRIQEAAIREDLATRKLDASGDVEKVLVRSLAAVQIALAFEQIHAVIWDGQLQLLETLNTVPDGIEETELAHVYEQEFRGKRAFYSEVLFESYLAWLFDQTLIRRDDGRLRLTVKGREFLKWMVDNGRAKRGVG